MIEKNYNVRRELPILIDKGWCRACLSAEYGEPMPRSVKVSRAASRKVFIPSNSNHE